MAYLQGCIELFSIAHESIGVMKGDDVVELFNENKYMSFRTHTGLVSALLKTDSIYGITFLNSHPDCITARILLNSSEESRLRGR